MAAGVEGRGKRHRSVADPHRQRTEERSYEADGSLRTPSPGGTRTARHPGAHCGQAVPPAPQARREGHAVPLHRTVLSDLLGVRAVPAPVHGLDGHHPVEPRHPRKQPHLRRAGQPDPDHPRRVLLERAAQHRGDRCPGHRAPAAARHVDRAPHAPQAARPHVLPDGCPGAQRHLGRRRRAYLRGALRARLRPHQLAAQPRRSRQCGLAGGHLAVLAGVGCHDHLAVDGLQLAHLPRRAAGGTGRRIRGGRPRRRQPAPEVPQHHDPGATADHHLHRHHVDHRHHPAVHRTTHVQPGAWRDRRKLPPVPDLGDVRLRTVLELRQVRLRGDRIVGHVRDHHPGGWRELPAVPTHSEHHMSVIPASRAHEDSPAPGRRRADAAPGRRRAGAAPRGRRAPAAPSRRRPRATTYLLHAFTQADYGRALLNSTIIATTVTISVVLTSTLAGFAFAKLRFRGNNGMLAFLVLTMMVPAQLGIIPLYIMMTQWLGWTGHLHAVIVPAATSAFGVFLMRQYLSEALPNELLEAGRVDGCSTTRLYWHVVLPAARPAAAVLALFTFMGAWNDFFWPLLALGQENPTVQVALSTLAGGYYMNYSLVLTGTLLSTVPNLLVFPVLGQQIIGGIMQGAIKA